MSIYQYDESNPHPAGFVGLRVVVSMPNGVKQRYYSFRRNGQWLSKTQENWLQRQAAEQEHAWKRERELHGARLDVRTRPTTRSQNSTGVRGINFAWPKRAQGSPSAVPALAINISHRKHAFAATVSIGQPGRLKQAWTTAIALYARHKQLTSLDQKVLLSRCPPLPEHPSTTATRFGFKSKRNGLRGTPEKIRRKA